MSEWRQQHTFQRQHYGRMIGNLRIVLTLSEEVTHAKCLGSLWQRIEEALDMRLGSQHTGKRAVC
jgi:hypothetical protein